MKQPDEIQKLFCEWCPKESADLCPEREEGCDSVKGFIAELMEVYGSN